MKRIILKDWESSTFHQGRLTQLRRPLNPQPNDFVHKLVYEEHPWSPSAFKGTPAEGLKIAKEGKVWLGEDWCGNVIGVYGYCPLGGAGSRLWVAETWARVHPGFLQHLDPDPDSFEWTTLYKADAIGGYEGKLMECTRWMSPVAMPQRFSRSIIEITAVRVERVQDITEEEAQACGADRVLMPDRGVIATPQDYEDELNCRFKNGFQFQWECDHGLASWDANPWVWVRDLRRVEK